LFCTEAWAIDVASQTDWTNAVAAVAAAGAGTTVSINITGGFTLTSSLAQIQAGNANVTVNVTGNNQTINGANTYQGIQVSGANAPNVNISSLAITNTAAFGGSGQNGQSGYYSSGLSYGSGGGGGGGLGAGGGLFIGGGANVTVASVTFTATSATGGAGGGGGAAQNAASSGIGGNGGAGGVANTSGATGGGGTGGSGGNTGTQGTVGAAGVALGGGGGGGGSGTTSGDYGSNNAGGVGANLGGRGGTGGDGATNHGGGPGADGGSGGAGGAALGGAVYVATGATLTILDTAISGASVTAGAGGAGGIGQGQAAIFGGAGGAGLASGSGIFLSGVEANIGVSTGTVTYANTIAGSGLTTAGVTTTLNKTGAGTLVLSGANAFTGNVNISSGALSVAASSNLGAGAKSVVLSDGATLAVTATGTFTPIIGYKISGLSSFDIASGATGTFMGAVSNGASTGNLVKTDAGSLVLSGTNTYTGSTTVSGGTLRAGSAGAFGTSSVFSVAAGAVLDLNGFNRTFGALSGAGSVTGGATTISGTLTPGNATAASSMAIGGNLGFQSGAQYVVQVNPTISSFATVTGTATLTGAGVQVVYSAGAYVGDTYTILHTGGLGGTTFASVAATGLPSGFSEILSYTATDVQLTLTALAATTIATAGTTYSASNLGAIVSPAFTGGTLVMDQAGNTPHTYIQNFTLGNSGTNTIDQHGAASIFSGNFTDATTGGGIIIANAGSGGSVTFSGQNTYTGSTAVNAGATLLLSGAGSIATSSRLVANGVFDISGVALGASVTTLAGGGSVVLGNRALTLTNANDTFAGSITGPGSLTIAGGSETLTGVSDFASTVINSGGALIVNGSITDPTVNSGGTLSGIGSVGATTVNAGGTLAPGSGGAGSLTVNGNLAFLAGAIYQVQINPSPASFTFTTVNGAATLGGATVNAIFANGSYINKVNRILTASGGVSGTFAPTVVTNLPANFSTTLTYDANDAYLNLNFSTPAAATLNSNQFNVATALTNSFNTAGGIPLAFGAMSAAQLTAIDGEAATGAQRGAFDMMNQFLALMVDPFADGRNPAAFGAAAFDTAATPPRAAEAAFTQNWSAWSAGFGGLNRANGDAAQGSTAIVARDYGYAAGLDYRLAPNTVVGFAFAGGGVNWGLAQGLGAGSGTTFQGGVYGATHFNSVYVSADFAFANHWLTTDRSALGDQLTAKFDAQDFGGRIEVGYRFNLPTPEAAIAVTPYAALQMQKYSAPSYSEADLGAGGFGLNYSATNATDVRNELGARLDAPTSLGGMPFVLRGRVAWAHDSIGSPALNATLQSLPGASFTVHGAPIPRDTALASVGAELRIANGWLVSAKFDGEFAKGSQTFAGSAAIRYTW
jgi:autotransporter-associated beta strand protein